MVRQGTIRRQHPSRSLSLVTIIRRRSTGCNTVSHRIRWLPWLCRTFKLTWHTLGHEGQITQAGESIGAPSRLSVGQLNDYCFRCMITSIRRFMEYGVITVFVTREAWSFCILEYVSGRYWHTLDVAPVVEIPQPFINIS